MTKVVTPSTKPITVQQCGKIGDLLTAELRKSKLKSAPTQEMLKTRGAKLAVDLAAVVQAYVDSVGETVRIDRSTPLPYPDWVDKPMNPELDKVGPDEYNLGDVDQWLHEKQKNGVVDGKEIYEHLKSADDLKNHLDLRDLLAIQKLGIEVFRKRFAGKAVFAWKSVVLGRSGGLRVPYLIGRGDEVKLGWHWLGHDWCDSNPALRFRK